MKRGKLLIASLMIWLSVLTCGAEAQWVQVDSSLTHSTLTYAKCFCGSGTNVFAGTYFGGVFLSTNNGATWGATSSPNFYIYSVAVRGTNLFAGSLGGVYRSTDNGTSWARTAPSGPDVYALAVNGTNVFAGTDHGVFLSTDDGTSWTGVSTGLTYLAVNALAVKGSKLFAATNDGNINFSTNNGTTWTPVTPVGGVVWSLAVSGTNLYASDGHVHLSTNNGASWVRADSGLPYYAGSFAVSGSNLFVGSLYGDGVSLSTNNGATWKAVNLGLRKAAVMSLAVIGTNLFAGTSDGGGIWRRPLSDSLLYGKVPEDLLVGYYPFSGNASDASGGGNHGIVSGATLTADRFGNPQSAYHFDGVTQYIRVPNSSGLQSVAYKTVSFWINMEPGGGPQNPRIISKGYTGGFEIGTAGTDVSRNILFVQPGVSMLSNGKVSSGLWHHCVWTYDGAVSSLYIDNAKDFTGAFIPSAVTTDMYIGRNSILNSADNFKGSIDDIRIYNRALSPSEISALYTEGGWIGNPDMGPVAYYPFNGNANDASGKGRDGVVYGATLTADRFGNAQSAFHFDGVTQYIRVPNSSGLQSVAYKTVSFWINMEPGGGPQNPRIISKGYTGGFEIGTAGTDVSRNILFVQPGVNFVSNGKVSSGSWHHCVWTYNGSVSSLYVDNVKDITGAFVPSPVTTDMYIGRNSALSSADNFKGSIDDIRIYNRALTAADVDSLYHEGGWDSGALPIQLTCFIATRVRDDSIRFAWTTISEINNYGFYVQRRDPGDQTFSDMVGSFVPGHGSTTQQHDYLFAANDVSCGETGYRLRQIDLEGTIHYSETIKVDGRAIQGAAIPVSPELAQNYPNPFNPSTTIRYGLSQRSNVRLELYNTLGQKVAGLVHEDQDAGYHVVKFDGANMASGVYFYRITAGNFVQTKKLLLVR